MLELSELVDIMENTRSSCNKITNIHCLTKIPASLHNITWTIENFSCCVERNGEKMVSSTFYASYDRKCKWELEIYPNGYEGHWNRYVSFFIRSLNYHTVTAKFVISVLNEKKQKVRSVNGKTVFDSFGQHSGTSQLIRRDELFHEKSGLLPNDSLTIHCELHVVGQLVNKKSAYHHTFKRNKLYDDLMQLFVSSDLSDVTIIVGNKHFRAHKAILAARSPVFSAMFNHDMKERKTNTIYIDDVEPQVMLSVISYMYSGKCPGIEEMAEDILKASDKYNIDDLKEECQDVLCAQLTPDNALRIFILADQHNLERLKSEAQLLRPFNGDVSQFLHWLSDKHNSSVQYSLTNKFMWNFVEITMYSAFAIFFDTFLAEYYVYRTLFKLS